jgi:dipeptidyl aminopeptidase/acylaminoacyl peptidase
MGSIKFSPDGCRFAAIAESNGQVRLVVVDFKTKQGRSFGNDGGSDVYSFRWLTNDLISIQNHKRGVRQFDLSAKDFSPAYISVDGKSRISRFDAASALGRVPGSQTDIVAVQAAGQHGSDQLVVVDSTNGAIKRRLTEFEDPGPRIHKWVLDRNLVPRAAMGWNASTGQRQVWWRQAPGDRWRLLLAYDPKTERGLVPVAMDANDNLLVLSNQLTGRQALYPIDRETGKVGRLLAGHPEVDIRESDLYFVDGEWEPVGVIVDADRPQSYWFDERRARVQAVVDASLPKNNHNTLEFLRDGKVLVKSASDRDPGTYYLYDPEARSLAEWTRSRPWIHPEQMAPMLPWRYRARDGLEIPAYLTLPLGREPRQLPLVVWVHAGPASRDSWGFDPEVQFSPAGAMPYCRRTSGAPPATGMNSSLLVTVNGARRCRTTWSTACERSSPTDVSTRSASASAVRATVAMRR